MRKITLEETIGRIKEIHKGEVSLYTNTFVSINEEASFLDSVHGEFKNKPEYVFRGVRHPSAAREKQGAAKRLKVETVLKKIKEKHGDIVTIDISTYINGSTIARFIDRDYGEWWRPPIVVMRGDMHPDRGYALRSKKQITSIQEVKKRLLEVHKGIVEIKEETYIKYSSKATFADTILKKEWEAYPTNVIDKGTSHPDREEEKRQQTILGKYGKRFTSQVPELALKQAKSSNICRIKLHWKTGEELVCQGGYETKLVDYFNAKQIDFRWQPQTFIMPDGKTYRPDAYLPEQDLWIEIKGYMRGDAQAKWDWFKTQFPTAELWDKKKLLSMGLLKYYE